jgi:hypothetical protein
VKWRRPLDGLQLRLDIFAIVAFAVLAYAAIEREWIMVGVALFAVLIAVLLPRMRGPFEVGGPVKLKGELIDPQVRLRGVVSPPSQAGEPNLEPPPAPPGPTQSPED